MGQALVIVVVDAVALTDIIEATDESLEELSRIMCEVVRQLALPSHWFHQ